MIDDILTNDNNMKFSGGNENFGVEESKEERDMDIEMEEDDEGELIPEFSMDDIVTHIQEPHKNLMLTREQKKSFKYLNKFQNIGLSNKNLFSKGNTPLSQK